MGKFLIVLPMTHKPLMLKFGEDQVSVFLFNVMSEKRFAFLFLT